MIKKKLNILLLLSLVLLFIGSFSTSYASVDATEIKNWILNTYCYNYNTNEYNQEKIQDVLTFISNHEEDINNMANVSENSNNTLLFGSTSLGDRALNNNINYYICDGNIYSTGDGNYIQYQNVKLRGTIRISNNTFTAYTTGSSASGYSQTWAKYYSDSPIYTSNEYTTIRHPAGSYPSGLLSSPYFTDDNFAFDINSDFTTVRLQNDQTLNEYYLIESSNSQYIRIGNQYDFSNLKGVTKRKFRYNIGSGQFDLINEYKSDLTNSGYFTINESEDICIIYETYQPDVIEVISLIPFDLATYQQIDIYLYFKSRYTSIVNGVVDFDNTFSGDYYNNYNNDTNTDKIINNINSGDNESVEDIINSELSGDADYIAVKLGWVPLDNPVSQYIRFILYGITDSILDSEEVTIPIQVYGMDLSLRSDAFTIPNNTLKLFLKYCLEALFIWNLIKFEYRLFTALTTMDIDAVSGTIEQADLYYNNDWRGM